MLATATMSSGSVCAASSARAATFCRVARAPSAAAAATVVRSSPMGGFMGGYAGKRGSTAKQCAGRRRAVHPEAAAKSAGPNPRGGKKMSNKKISKKRNEFIEQDNEKDALAAQMREASMKANKNAKANAVFLPTGSEQDGGSGTTAAGAGGPSFDEKLRAVREEGEAVRQARAAATPSGTLMDSVVAGSAGRGLPSLPGGSKSIYDAPPQSKGTSPGGITIGQLGEKTDEDEGVKGFVRIGAGFIALGLLVVFIPSDDFRPAQSSRSQQGALTPEVMEQVRKQADELTKALASSPEDIEKLKGAAESYVVLEEYLAAAPLLERLLELEPSVDNAGNLADVWNAAKKPFKAAEVYRNAVESEWSGPRPSPTLLKGLVDSLDKDGRYGLSLSFIRDYQEKGYCDDVDSKLLVARVYSGWKGHGKDAEETYQAVITAHPDDFRGYLAKGVFLREVGKPEPADALFRQAKSLAPREMAEVVASVVQQAKATNK